MKLLIQRVISASVNVANQQVAAIGKGALVFVGVTHQDTFEDAKWLANKLIHLRFFEDDNGKTNHSLLELNRQLLVVSQFTLYADCSKGRRPAFVHAADPEKAKNLIAQFIAYMREQNICVETGVFGAHMEVSLVNDGPMTLMLER